MEKHFLVTVGDDPSFLWGVRFLGYFFAKKDDIRLTLFYTAPRAAAVWAKELNYETQQLAAETEARAEAASREALNRARQRLELLGYPAAQVESKLVKRRFSKAQDIIQEADSGLYDAVVLGRRALTGIEEAMGESTTKGLLQERIDFPLWICREPEVERTGILLCVDGSEEADRMADHVGFVAAHEHRHPVTVCLVRNGGGEPDAVLHRAEEILAENGVDAALIRRKVLDGAAPAKAILAEAASGRHAVVAVGRRSAGRTLLQRLFAAGSVSHELFTRLSGAALWVSR